MQRQVLEIVAKKRRCGALRTELCKMLRIESTRFHYVINVSLYHLRAKLKSPVAISMRHKLFHTFC